MSGYFDQDSMVVRALSTRVVGLTYGQRALILGGLHPRLFVGTAQHTSHRASPYRRLGLTARLFEAVFLGTKDEADRALAFAAKRHSSVHGTMDIDGGPEHPAGSPYDASDPELMWWTAAFTLDSVEATYDALVRPLNTGQREELFAGFVTWAGLFGMPRSAAPNSYGEFRTTFDTWLASDVPHPVDDARLIGRHLAGLSGYNLPLKPVVSPTLGTVVRGSLPAAVRHHYDIRWTARDEAAWQALRAVSRLAHSRISPVTRTPILRGRSREFYKVVQTWENQLIAHGGVSIPGVSDTPPAYTERSTAR